ncbi:asparagine synthase (glutamine-hydrolyzing) [Butyrivibrio fibrisolvens]|uniref:asparagine synthase (glutamine-hydrolyzing) n=1 Tax=Butyrivibrio fibrisolvens TaxID=831 RepID=UPI0003FB0A4D|nr:asparagine synthase (glutamine-hydrolyzing) [Butyrivibrio fibrisolvens]
MCGIAGYITKKNTIKSDDTIKNMISLIEHRGPDDNGFEKLDIFNFDKGPDMAMGFVRLSILDVSNQGHQPMSDEKGQVFITFNGEVYNAFDYRDELISKGYVFHSHTDTEVVLNLYMEYGLEGMLERINGMFAICIADIRTREVYLIRDRLGVKPLYYYDTSDAFLYASEVKAFYASEYFDNQLNVDAISEHFVFRYVAGKNTLFKNVYNVLPAHYIKISSDGIEEIRYWDIKSSSDREMSVSDYEDLIDKSVKDRMLSDVKLGVQLSGGIDSSIVTACASRYKEDLESYSVIFEDDSYSEKKWMDMVAEKYPIKQHQEYQKIENFDVEFEKATWFLDTPLNHPNSIGIYNMCSIAKKNDVKVLLTGEGADEVFGGYRRYASFLTAQKYKLLSEISSRLRGTKLSSSKSYEEKFISTGAFVKEDELKKLIPGGSWDEAINTRRDMYKESCEGRDRFSKALNYELKTYLVDILNRQDKMSMAASLETRVPFLNYELIEKVRSQKTSGLVRASLIDKKKYSHMKYTKIPLKKVSEKLFGTEFTYRPKQGFGYPLRSIYLSLKYKNHVESVLLPELKKCEFINGKEVERLWSCRDKISNDELESLWVVLSFAQWHYLFMESKERVINFKNRIEIIK